MTKYVDVDTLTLGWFNPQIRTEEKNLKDLTKSMAERGFLPEFPIIVASDRTTIGDGHRRYTVARSLGIKTVPVVYSSYTADQIFAMQFSGRRTTTSKELLAAAVNGVDVESLPFEFVRDYKRLVEHCGVQAIQYLLKRHHSPAKVDYVIRIKKYLCKTLNIQFDVNDGFRILVWLTQNNMPSVVQHYIRLRKSPEMLLLAINTNEVIEL